MEKQIKKEKPLKKWIHYEFRNTWGTWFEILGRFIIFCFSSLAFIFTLTIMLPEPTLVQQSVIFLMLSLGVIWVIKSVFTEWVDEEYYEEDK